jgi:hypothetical protein
MPDNTVDLKGKIVAINLMPPYSHYSKLGSLWQYRYTVLRSAGRELLSHGVAAIILLLMIL